MTRPRTHAPSVLRGAAFGAACGASFWAVFLAFARSAAPTAQTEPVPCVQGLRAEAPNPGPSGNDAAGPAGNALSPQLQEQLLGGGLEATRARPE